jgi:hypothetical protein
MSVRPTLLQLVGYGGRDFQAGVATHRSTQIVYRIQPGGGRTWLVREEAHLDARSNQHICREFVCSDVAEIRAVRLENSDLPADSDSNAPQRLYPVPRRLHLTLKRSDGTAVVDQILLLGPGI